MTPRLPFTVNFPLRLPGSTVHAPPISALPHPFDEKREKLSAISLVGDPLDVTAAVVVTGALGLPFVSVTVSVTVYVPPLTYVCAGVAPVAVLPSPKFHA